MNILNTLCDIKTGFEETHFIQLKPNFLLNASIDLDCDYENVRLKTRYRRGNNVVSYTIKFISPAIRKLIN